MSGTLRACVAQQQHARQIHGAASHPGLQTIRLRGQKDLDLSSLRLVPNENWLVDEGG